MTAPPGLEEEQYEVVAAAEPDVFAQLEEVSSIPDKAELLHQQLLTHAKELEALYAKATPILKRDVHETWIQDGLQRYALKHYYDFPEHPAIMELEGMVPEIFDQWIRTVIEEFRRTVSSELDIDDSDMG